MTILAVTLSAPLTQRAVSLEGLEVVLLDRLEGVHEVNIIGEARIAYGTAKNLGRFWYVRLIKKF
jgi:hypothetical protein